MFFNKKKPDSPIPASEDDLFSSEADEPIVESQQAATTITTTVGSGFNFPKLSPSSLSNTAQTQQKNGAFSSQSATVPSDATEAEVSLATAEAVSIAANFVGSLPAVESVQEDSTANVEAFVPPSQVFADNEIVETDSVPLVANSIENAFDMALDLSSVDQADRLETNEAFFGLELEAPYLPAPEELNAPVIVEPVAIAETQSSVEDSESWMDFALDSSLEIVLPETEAVSASSEIKVPTQINACEIGEDILEPQEEPTDQIALQTRHAVAGTEAFLQTQFSPIDSSIDLTGLAVEDSFDTLSQANELNSNWVLQDIAVAEEQVALYAPQQPTISGFLSVENNQAIGLMDISQLDSFVIGDDFNDDPKQVEEENVTLSAVVALEPVDVTWSVQAEPDLTVVEPQFTTQAAEEVISANHLDSLNDAFDFTVVDEAPVAGAFKATIDKEALPLPALANPIIETVPVEAKKIIEPEAYTVNEYDEVVVDFDSGSLDMDATTSPEQLLSSIDLSPNEIAPAIQSLVNGVNEYDEVVVDFDSGSLDMDATTSPEQLLSTASNPTELIDPSFWVALNGESAEDTVKQPASTTEDEFNQYVVAGFEANAKTVYDTATVAEASPATPEPIIALEHEKTIATATPVTEGMISLAELVGSNMAPAPKEQGNILGLSETKTTLQVGQVLPFYNLALEKINVLAMAPLPQENSALLYLEIEPFFALFGFVDNQFHLLRIFQKNLLKEGATAQFNLTLNAQSATTGDIYQLTIGSWVALIVVKDQHVALHKILTAA
ncbi:MAG: hypothetical protein NTW61_08825 [Candidatus Melainabacteria bacterium]|nr:hypothetical protein [Candidatus Melainabacteria bacterium]